VKGISTVACKGGTTYISHINIHIEGQILQVTEFLLVTYIIHNNFHNVSYNNNSQILHFRIHALQFIQHNTGQQIHTLLY